MRIIIVIILLHVWLSRFSLCMLHKILDLMDNITYFSLLFGFNRFFL